MDTGAEIQREVLAEVEGRRDFQRLQRMLEDWQARGVPAELLADELTDLMLDLRAQNRADDEDAVGRVLDTLGGW
ncbi:hypothetical protein [Saccharothrix lopnurensis]|uniref:CopG family transcriptional regulator n=1 Tax=Saccharothrix lopnurensis TaxID=1670621 RepID=A0ABW1PBA1_9PSEU